MITRRVSLGGAIAAALVTTVGMVTVLGGPPGHGSSSGANAATGDADAGTASGCPTGEEIQAYWEQHGRDLKSAATCGDPDPVLPGDGAEHSHDAESSHADLSTEPTTLEEAQELLDPADDPLIHVGKDAAGRWFAMHVTMAPGENPPPASVRTVQEFAAWVEARGTN